MKLHEFIKDSLVDIARGVEAAEGASAIQVLPGTGDGKGGFTPQQISFEVAVTTSSEAGGGLSVVALGDLKAIRSADRVNRLSFSVPVFLRTAGVRKREEEA